jgi:hypothetical protein
MDLTTEVDQVACPLHDAKVTAAFGRAHLLMTAMRRWYGYLVCRLYASSVRNSSGRELVGFALFDWRRMALLLSPVYV